MEAAPSVAGNPVTLFAAIISFALVVRDPNRQRDIPFIDGFGKKAASFIEAKKKEIASRIEKKREEKRLSALAKPSVYIRERGGKARPANPAFDVAR